MCTGAVIGVSPYWMVVFMQHTPSSLSSSLCVSSCSMVINLVGSASCLCYLALTNPCHVTSLLTLEASYCFEPTFRWLMAPLKQLPGANLPSPTFLTSTLCVGNAASPDVTAPAAPQYPLLPSQSSLLSRTLGFLP